MNPNGIVLKTWCPECRGVAGLVIGWKPPQGIDPQLRAFKCVDCGSLFYKVVKPEVIEIYQAALR